MSSPFIHLHIHSEYSLYDSVVRIKSLVAQAKENNMPAVALTDMANLFAVVKFYHAAVAAGIKPIIGSDVWIENSDDHNKPFRLVLLCQDIEGYRNLSRLLTRAYTDGQHSGRPCISRDWINQFAGGLIALSGAQDGDIGQALISKTRHWPVTCLAITKNYLVTGSTLSCSERASHIRRNTYTA